MVMLMTLPSITDLLVVVAFVIMEVGRVIKLTRQLVVVALLETRQLLHLPPVSLMVGLVDWDQQVSVLMIRQQIMPYLRQSLFLLRLLARISLFFKTI